MTMLMNFTKGSLVAWLLALKDVGQERMEGRLKAKSRLNLLTSCVFLYLLFMYLWCPYFTYLWCRSKSRQPWMEGRGKIVSPAAHKRPTDRTHNLYQTGVLFFLHRCPSSSWTGVGLLGLVWLCQRVKTEEETLWWVFEVSVKIKTFKGFCVSVKTDNWCLS